MLTATLIQQDTHKGWAKELPEAKADQQREARHNQTGQAERCQVQPWVIGRPGKAPGAVHIVNVCLGDLHLMVLSGNREVVYEWSPLIRPDTPAIVSPTNILHADSIGNTLKTLTTAHA